MSIIWPRMLPSSGRLWLAGNYSARKPVSIYNQAGVDTVMSVKKLLDLTGKIALVTGGSRGLGLQIAESLGEMGAKLALTARKADELEEARQHLSSQGIEALARRCGLSQPEAIGPMLSKLLERFGKV